MKILGYGICGPGEADRYLEHTLNEFKRLCDVTIIVLNNVTPKERTLIHKYGFITIEDNREWGKEQNNIKQNLMSVVKTYKPDYCVCLDMDEVFDEQMTKEDLLHCFETGDSLYFYIVNLWNEGWNRQWSFWNIRAWRFTDDLRIYNRPLHCGLAPEWTYYSASYAPFFVKHYGLMKKSDRQAKIDRYNKYDPTAKYKDRSYYDALAQDKNEPIDWKYIREALIKEVGIQTKRGRTTKKQRKLFYVQRFVNGKDIGTIDIPEEYLKETLARNKGWVVKGEVGKASDRDYPKSDPLACCICGQVQPSAQDLLIHKQLHQ